MDWSRNDSTGKNGENKTKKEFINQKRKPK
jgi:hypothetical protein